MTNTLSVSMNIIFNRLVQVHNLRVQVRVLSSRVRVQVQVPVAQVRVWVQVLKTSTRILVLVPKTQVDRVPVALLGLNIRVLWHKTCSTNFKIVQFWESIAEVYSRISIQNSNTNNQSVLTMQSVMHAATCCSKMCMTGLNQSLIEIASACQLEPELWKFVYNITK